MTGPGIDWQHLTKDQLDFQLSPSRSAKDAMGVLTRLWSDTASTLRDPSVRFHLDVSYGARPRETYDVYAPADATAPSPALVFIHGGFWQEGDKGGSGFAARALAAQGWALVGIGYTLTPEVRLRDIVAEVAAALEHVADHAADYGIDPARIVLAGHSAGGHLTAAILAGMGGARAAGIPAGAVPISGVYDLAPIAASYVNDLAGIDATEIADLSPLFARPLRDIPVHLLIGGDEPDAFQVQSTALHAAWAPHLSHLTLERVPGHDHFDILDRLAETGDDTFRAIRAMV
jgi:arylformamidase